MSTRIITSVALTGVLVLASCMQDTAKAPFSPTEPSLGKAPASCPFNTIRGEGRGVFTDNKDAFFALLDTMQANYVASGGATAAQNATPGGFKALGRLGIATDQGLVTTNVALRDTLANDLLSPLCMAVDGYSSRIDFKPALGGTGLFAVRAGGLATAVISRGDDINGKPLFGAEPSGSQWHATAPYILFWGYPIETSSFTNETPGGQAFQLNELPTLSFTGNQIRTGVCRMESGARILHEHSNLDVILPDASEPNFCTNEPNPTTPVGFRGIMQRVGDWLAPQPLYAFAFGGGGSALVGDLSPLGPVTFQVDTIAFVFPIPNARVKQTVDQFNSKVAVRVVSANGTPVDNVRIHLTVVGNQGSFTQPTDNDRFTDETGTAVFSNFYLDKAGGYTITASTTEFGGFTTTSNLFNVSGR
jgi:hypothetical protein